MQVNHNGESTGFWILMGILASVLIIGGLVVIITGMGSESSAPAIISFLGAKFEGNDVGLAVIFLGLLAALLAYKERADIRKHKQLRSDIDGAIKLAGGLAAKYGEQRLAARSGASDERTKRLRAKIKQHREEAEKGALAAIQGKIAQEIMDLSGEVDKELSNNRPSNN